MENPIKMDDLGVPLLRKRPYIDHILIPMNRKIFATTKTLLIGDVSCLGVEHKIRKTSHEMSNTSQDIHKTSTGWCLALTLSLIWSSFSREKGHQIAHLLIAIRPVNKRSECFGQQNSNSNSHCQAQKTFKLSTLTTYSYKIPFHGNPRNHSKSYETQLQHKSDWRRILRR